jgi:hypothetical protein
MMCAISENSFVKQLLINKLNLSIDLLDTIKSYCFYDVKSWETIQFIKNKKRRIHYLFTNVTISRANPHDVYFHDENTDQHWAFWTYDEEDGENAQFQSYNCKYCGNYKMISNDEVYIDKIVCHCNNDYDDLPDLISINSEDNEENEFDYFDDDSIGV